VTRNILSTKAVVLVNEENSYWLRFKDGKPWMSKSFSSIYRVAAFLREKGHEDIAVLVVEKERLYSKMTGVKLLPAFKVFKKK